jgi:hypothetical protein
MSALRIIASLDRQQLWRSPSGALKGRPVVVAPVEAPTIHLGGVTNPFEGNPAVATIVINKPWDVAITVTHTTTAGTAVAGTDYTTTNGTATIPIGATSVTVPIPTLERAGDQGTRTFTVTLSSPLAGATPLATTAGRSLATTVSIYDSAVPVGDHGYFETLINRSDYWCGMSFRPVAGRPQFFASGPHAGKPDPYYAGQLLANNAGGYQQTPATSFTYNPAGDTDAQKQDAAQFRIGAWNRVVWTGVLTQDLLPGAMTLFVSEAPQGVRHLRLNEGLPNEEIICVDSAGSVAAGYTILNRGLFGTTAQTHVAATTQIRRSTNNLQDQVRFPLNATEGNSYFLVWDLYLTNSFDSVRGTGLTYKAFQFQAPRPPSGLWHEPRIGFDGGSTSGNPITRPADWTGTAPQIGSVNTRTYSTSNDGTAWSPDTTVLGPGTIRGGGDAIAPQAGRFTLERGRWVRWIQRFDIVPGDYGYHSSWMADSTRGVVPIHTDLRVNVRTLTGTSAPQLIQQWWVEFNTSSDRNWRGGNHDLVAYIRNFVALQAPLGTADWAPLLTAPS